jgi:hypothetical protein
MNENYSGNRCRGRKKKAAGSGSKSFSLSLSPKSLVRRLVHEKIPKLKQKGFFLGINVNSPYPKKLKHPEKLPLIYLDNDSVCETQYQELVDSFLDKGNHSFQLGDATDLNNCKIGGEKVMINDIRVCGRFKQKFEERKKNLLPQTSAKISSVRPIRIAKLNIGGVQALAYQKITTKEKH